MQMINSKERVRDHGEVYTPQWLVSDMCDLVDSEIRDINKKILQPSCGNGNFVMQFLKRRLQVDDLNKEYVLASIKTLYGVDILEDNIKETKQWVLDCINDYIEIDEQFKLKIMQILDSNFICTDWIKDDVFDYIQFDLVITNPPYQKMDGGFGASARPVYQHFINKAIADNSRFIVMVIPARWYTGGKGLNEFRKQMINDTCIKELHDYQHSETCFKRVDIKGGICYFSRDNQYNGKCKIVSYDKNKTLISQTKRFLKYKNFNLHIRYNESMSVLDKILKYSFNSFMNLVHGKDTFSFKTNFKDYKKEPFDNSIKLYARKQVGYIDRNNIKKNPDLIDKWKVFITVTYGGGSGYQDQVLNKPIIGEPYSICTDTYLYIGSFKNKQEVLNVISYMETKFFRFLVFLIKNTQHCARGVYQFVPIQDFSKQWTDQELYKKYDLTQDQIDYIQSKIKPMKK